MQHLLPSFPSFFFLSFFSRKEFEILPSHCNEAFHIVVVISYIIVSVCVCVYHLLNGGIDAHTRRIGYSGIRVVIIHHLLPIVKK